MRILDFFKGKREPISWFEGQDIEMLQAIGHAQAIFHDFVSALDVENSRIAPIIEEALVKYAFPATKKGVQVEHIFLSNIEKRDSVLWGVVTGAPRYTNAVKEGQNIEIDPQRISDWLYVVNGKGVGGFTFKLMWSRFSDQEKSVYGAQPPFVWINAL